MAAVTWQSSHIKVVRVALQQVPLTHIIRILTQSWMEACLRRIMPMWGKTTERIQTYVFSPTTRWTWSNRTTKTTRLKCGITPRYRTSSAVLRTQVTSRLWIRRTFQAILWRSVKTLTSVTDHHLPRKPEFYPIPMLETLVTRTLVERVEFRRLALKIPTLLRLAMPVKTPDYLGSITLTAV